MFRLFILIISIFVTGFLALPILKDSYKNFTAFGVNGHDPIDVKVLVINYFPLDPSDNTRLNPAIADGNNKLLTTMRTEVEGYNEDGITNRTNATKFRGYNNSSAQPALNLSILETKEYLEALPISTIAFSSNTGIPRPNYIQVLNRENICNYVDNLGVKEVWLWGYHTSQIEPAESNMSMGTNSSSFYNMGSYGDISNSEKSNDMPRCQKTYTLYNFNYNNANVLHNHGHHIEALMGYVDSNLWSKFVNPYGQTTTTNHCGWTHNPPNTNASFSGHYCMSTVTNSDCMDWKPDGGGAVSQVTCSTWADPFPNVIGEQDKFLSWWMQNIPGMNNNIPYDGPLYPGGKLRNWWEWLGDFDTAIARGRSLHFDRFGNPPVPMTTFSGGIRLGNFTSNVSNLPNAGGAVSVLVNQYNTQGSEPFVLKGTLFGQLTNFAPNKTYKVSMCEMGGVTCPHSQNLTTNSSGQVSYSHPVDVYMGDSSPVIAVHDTDPNSNCYNVNSPDNSCASVTLQLPLNCDSKLLKNGCFEHNTVANAQWTCQNSQYGSCVVDTTTKISGNNSMKITYNTGYSTWGTQLWQPGISLAQGQSACLSYLLKKGNSGNTQVSVFIQEGAAPYRGSTTSTLVNHSTTDWQLVRGTVTVGSDWTVPVHMVLRTTQPGDFNWVDDVRLTAGACQ